MKFRPETKPLRNKYPYSELLWSAFSPNMENTDQNNSEYGYFSRSEHNKKKSENVKRKLMVMS